jgi:hypothetical protein
MTAQLFRLVYAHDESGDPPGSGIFAWGMQITDDHGERDQVAVVYRQDETGHRSFGVHASAESACRLHSHHAPVDLVWGHDPQPAPATELRTARSAT